MARPAAAERLGRLLAIVPWVASHDGPLLSDVSRRFGVSESDLVADLELLFMCGVYPFTPDSLIEVDVADGRVWIRFADWFRRPLRLTAPEGLALVSAGRALLDLPGADDTGALSRAMEKLETVLGVGAEEAVDVDLGSVDASTLSLVQRAVPAREKLKLDYYSFGRDGRSERVVQPWRVFNAGGEWYLQAWCEMAGGERLFRLDRIIAAEPTGEHTTDPPPRPKAGPPAVYEPDSDDPVVILELDPPAHWIADLYPNEGVERVRGDVLVVRLRAGQRAWLERLLLRAGPDARIRQGDKGIRAAAARRLLRRYERSSP